MPLKKYNLALILLPILIFSCGFMSLLSTFSDKARAQFIFFLIGVLFYVLISSVDFRLFKIFWKGFYYVVLVFLLLTFLLGEVRLGSARWFSLGIFTFQPSEFAKIAVTLGLAAIINLNPKILLTIKGLFRLVLFIIPMVVLVIIQPDLGTGLVVLGIFVGILFYAGVKKIYFIVTFLVFGILSSPFWNLLRDYQKKRIITFFNPSLDTLGAGYNVIQSIVAVGSGQLWGKGFGRGTQSHLHFLPAFWTDFVFAAFAEEWGFVGVFVFLSLFTFLCFGILYVSYKTTDLFGSLLCVGVFLIFFLQFVVNVGMNLGLMPVTGIPLPLVSYGGSSMLTSMILLGIVQSVWVYGRRVK